jgi:glycosyltransferase involved in cell wall biosynthesis
LENKKHILFISSWYPNRLDPTHGIFNRHFAEAAAIKNKVSVLHVASDPGLTSETELVESDEGGIHTIIVYYKKVSSHTPFISQFRKRQLLIAAFDKGYSHILLSQGRVDLIQLNVIMPNGLGALHLSKKFNLPLVINEGWTGYMEEDGNYKGFFQKYFTRKIVKRATHIMPVSESLMKEMLRHKLSGSYTIVPNVVNTERFVPISAAKDEVTRLIHISTLDQAQKNVQGIIHAFANALRKNQKMQLTIVGEGEHKEYLEKLVDQQKLSDKISFKGVVLGPDMVQEINKHDALLMFSNFESFGVVVAEAMACGKPVITSDCGGLTTSINETYGYKVEPRN